ncbi:MAG TPA: ABC transporter substrate-binding protein [Gemmatimonadales bacterium]|nr:ABC transporter substrate-binding protein [Gemmatimonadales bacterium]
MFVPDLRRLRPLGLAALCLGLLGTAGCAASDGPVRIGLAGPFDDPVGRPMKLAAELAVEEINRAGGINGRMIELLAQNDHNNTDSAVAVAERLRATDVSAVIGHLFSGTTLQAAPIYNGGSNPVVQLSPSSSSPEVSYAGPWTFRVCPSDLDHGRALASWVRDGLHYERGTVFYLNDQYGRGIRQTFVEEFRKRGGAVLAVNPYLGDVPEVGPYVERLARDGRSQFMLVAGNLSEGQQVLREARARGVQLPIMGGDGLEGLEGTGAIAEGSYESAAYLPTIETPANRRFVEAWHAKYPAAGQPNQPAAATYDAVYLLADVIRSAGTGRRAVREALASRDAAHPFEGVTGRIAFDSLGDVPSRTIYIAVVKNGALHLAGER